MPAKNRASSKKKASSGQTSFLKKMAGGRKKSSKARSSKTALLNKITQFRKTPIDEITGKKSAHFSKLCRQYSSAADSAANIEEGHDSVDGSMEEEEHFLVQEGASVLARVAPAQRCDTDSAAAGEGSAKQPSARKRQTEASMANNCVQSHELGPSR